MQPAVSTTEGWPRCRTVPVSLLLPPPGMPGGLQTPLHQKWGVYTLGCTPKEKKPSPNAPVAARRVWRSALPTACRVLSRSAAPAQRESPTLWEGPALPHVPARILFLWPTASSAWTHRSGKSTCPNGENFVRSLHQQQTAAAGLGRDMFHPVAPLLRHRASSLDMAGPARGPDPAPAQSRAGKHQNTTALLPPGTVAQARRAGSPQTPAPSLCWNFLVLWMSTDWWRVWKSRV